ncbi:MAG: glycosyltransferase [Rhodospirillales bacterium]|nr:glycosyltransferase [Rhodospirillales bacterium]
MPPESVLNAADVSVILPAFNARATIARALTSIAAQTVKPREVIVVDDGSTDGTFEAAGAAAQGLEGIELKVIRQDNRGAGAARNRAVREAVSSVLAFLDADDEWLPAHLEASLAHMHDGDYVLTAHDGIQVAPDGGESFINCTSRFNQGPDPLVTLYRKGYIDTCTVLARRDAVIKAGGFDETLPNAQDFELWLAILKAPDARFLVFADALSRYHITPGGIMSNTERRLDCCLRIASDYARALKDRPGSPLMHLCYRVLAVHFEAMMSYKERNKFTAALWTLARAPFSMIAHSIRFLFAIPKERTDFLQSRVNSATMNDPCPTLPAFAVPALYLWATVVLGLYLYQFRPLMGGILRALGLG